jgi:hypothetical protein
MRHAWGNEAKSRSPCVRLRLPCVWPLLACVWWEPCGENPDLHASRHNVHASRVIFALKCAPAPSACNQFISRVFRLPASDFSAQDPAAMRHVTMCMRQRVNLHASHRILQLKDPILCDVLEIAATGRYFNASRTILWTETPDCLRHTAIDRSRRSRGCVLP